METSSDKAKQSLYFPEEMLVEIRQEAERMDRSLSWVVQRAWKIGKKEVHRLPSEPELGPDSELMPNPEP